MPRMSALRLSAIVLLGVVLAGGVWLAQGGMQSLSLQIVAWQRDLHRALTLAITELSGTPSSTAWAALLGISFGYGFFHAAGPGHGKAVLATYLLSQGGATRRALALSCAASLLQALVAILIVVVLVHGLGWLTRQAMGSVAWVEQASFVMVALLGAWLCWRALRQLRQGPSFVVTSAPREQAPSPFVAVPVRSGHAPHAHAHAHGDHCQCGSAHHVAPSQASDWRTALGTVVAIGIRPCSGGVLLMGAASLLGLFWVGVAAVLVMAAGTALAVSALALACVFARDWAQRRLLTPRRSSQRMARAMAWTALGGGVAIMILGLSLTFAGVASPTRAPLLGEPPAQVQDRPAERPRTPFG